MIVLIFRALTNFQVALVLLESLLMTVKDLGDKAGIDMFIASLSAEMKFCSAADIQNSFGL